MALYMLPFVEIIPIHNYFTMLALLFFFCKVESGGNGEGKGEGEACVGAVVECTVQCSSRVHCTAGWNKIFFCLRMQFF